jgi:PAS domain S-box-containing protein
MPFGFRTARGHRLHQVLRDERRVLDAVLDNVNVAVVACDLQGRVTHANRRAGELVAFGPLGAEPREWVERLRPRSDDGAAISADQLPMLRALSGETVHDVDVHVEGERGEMVLSMTANPIEDARGRRIGAVVALEDVTEQRRREARTRAALRDVGLAGEVDDALRSGNLLLYAQPVVGLRSGQTVLEELLLRVRTSDGAVKGPCPFLAAAERYDTITALDLWVLERAVEIARAGRALTINVSAQTIGRPLFLEAVEYLLERDALKPSLLTFEITESAVVSDIVMAARFAERLHDIGCHFALDDFGTGYAALTYLKNLPIQYLKIDRDFVRDLGENKRSTAVVSGIVSLASGFGQQTIAEGVENDATLTQLRELGVDLAQGYFIGEPAPLALENSGS